MTRIALIGLGEVGRVLAQELGSATLTAWDVDFADPDSPASRNARQLAIGVATDARAAVSDAELIISAVTAANDHFAAQAAAVGIAKDAWFLDVNSASPQQKQASAQTIAQAGARYVEAAVMSPIEPRRLDSPMLLGGPHAAEFAEFARPLGFSGLEVYSDVVGPASATKLCRSVMVKGVEALITESMLAARAWGVEDRVLDSLSNLLPAADWRAMAQYMISRSLEHGARRAEEMHEAAATVAATGVEPTMSIATAQRQAETATHRAALDAGGLIAILDAIRRDADQRTSA